MYLWSTFWAEEFKMKVGVTVFGILTRWSISIFKKLFDAFLRYKKFALTTKFVEKYRHPKIFCIENLSDVESNAVYCVQDVQKL